MVDDQTAEDLRLAAGNLADALVEIEMGLTDLRMSGGMAGQDRLRWPRQLYAKLTSLAGYIGSSDFRPTQQQLEVKGIYDEQLALIQQRVADLIFSDLGALNGLLGEHNVPNIVSTIRPAAPIPDQ